MVRAGGNIIWEQIALKASKENFSEIEIIEKERNNMVTPRAIIEYGNKIKACLRKV